MKRLSIALCIVLFAGCSSPIETKDAGGQVEVGSAVDMGSREVVITVDLVYLKRVLGY